MKFCILGAIFLLTLISPLQSMLCFREGCFASEEWLLNTNSAFLFCSYRHSTVHMMQKPHQCPHCPFAARMASHLRRHLRLHTGAKPYRCPYCSYTCNILVSNLLPTDSSQAWIRSFGHLTIEELRIRHRTLPCTTYWVCIYGLFARSA